MGASDALLLSYQTVPTQLLVRTLFFAELNPREPCRHAATAHSLVAPEIHALVVARRIKIQSAWQMKLLRLSCGTYQHGEAL